MDLDKFLTDLHSELEQIDREIRALGLFDASRFRLGPALSASELEPFRKDTASARRRSDQMLSLQ
jgi:hypothetical protein